MTMTSNDRSTERVKSISRYHCVCREDANLWNLTGVVGFESNESEVAADKDKDKPMITIVSSSRSLIETGARLIKSAVPPSLSLRDERNRTQVAAAINRWAQTHPSPPPSRPCSSRLSFPIDNHWSIVVARLSLSTSRDSPSRHRKVPSSPDKRTRVAWDAAKRGWFGSSRRPRATSSFSIRAHLHSAGSCLVTCSGTA